jgi:hypothetical protein
LKGALEKLHKASDKLKKIFGWGPSFGRLGNDDQGIESELRSIAEQRITNLGDRIVRVESSLNDYKQALNRVIHERPPAKNKEQFRDSLIWEAVLKLAHSYDVYFVTNDKKDYCDNPKSQNPDLAEELKKECDDAGISLHFHTDLQSCLEQLQQDVPEIDYNQLTTAIHSEIIRDAKEASLRRQFTLRSLSEGSVKPFYTENAEVLALDFEMKYEISNQDSGQVRNSASLTAKGSCFYNYKEQGVFEVTLDEFLFQWTDGSGQLKQNRDLFVRVVGSIGQEDTVYSFRVAVIEDQD